MRPIVSTLDEKKQPLQIYLFFVSEVPVERALEVMYVRNGTEHQFTDRNLLCFRNISLNIKVQFACVALHQAPLAWCGLKHRQVVWRELLYNRSVSKTIITNDLDQKSILYFINLFYSKSLSNISCQPVIVMARKHTKLTAEFWGNYLEKSIFHCSLVLFFNTFWEGSQRGVHLSVNIREILEILALMDGFLLNETIYRQFEHFCLSSCLCVVEDRGLMQHNSGCLFYCGCLYTVTKITVLC